MVIYTDIALHTTPAAVAQMLERFSSDASLFNPSVEVSLSKKTLNPKMLLILCYYFMSVWIINVPGKQAGPYMIFTATCVWMGESKTCHVKLLWVVNNE